MRFSALASGTFAIAFMALMACSSTDGEPTDRFRRSCYVTDDSRVTLADGTAVQPHTCSFFPKGVQFVTLPSATQKAQVLSVAFGRWPPATGTMNVSPTSEDSDAYVNPYSEDAATISIYEDGRRTERATGGGTLRLMTNADPSKGITTNAVYQDDGQPTLLTSTIEFEAAAAVISSNATGVIKGTVSFTSRAYATRQQAGCRHEVPINPGGATCLVFFHDCSKNADCSSCDGAICDVGRKRCCGDDGVHCTEDGQCCSGHCVDGACVKEQYFAHKIVTARADCNADDRTGGGETPGRTDAGARPDATDPCALREPRTITCPPPTAVSASCAKAYENGFQTSIAVPETNLLGGSWTDDTSGLPVTLDVKTCVLTFDNNTSSCKEPKITCDARANQCRVPVVCPGDCSFELLSCGFR